MLEDLGKVQPVLDWDLVIACYNIVRMGTKTDGQIYELGGPFQYEQKELMEFLANVLGHRPLFYKMTYDDMMRIHHSPNSHFEV